MKKGTLIIIPLAILVFVGLLLFLLLHRASSPSTPPSTSSQFTLPNPPEPPPSSLPLAQTTDEARANALNAVLKDTQGNPWITDQNNTRQYILANEKNYMIIYFGKYDSFLIQILAQPFDENRGAAELRFLQIINAPAEIACQLKVTVNTTYAVDPVLSGNNFGLSFCK